MPFSGRLRCTAMGNASTPKASELTQYAKVLAHDKLKIHE
jgi:hypothetical protein